MAGANLNKLNPWIDNYIKNPKQNENNENTSNNYYVIRRANNPVARVMDTGYETTDNEDRYVILKKSSNLEHMRLDEYYLDETTSEESITNSLKNSKNIHSLIKHYYTNPLNLQELSRIQIRNILLKFDSKIKHKIQTRLPLPNKLKDFLLFKEFNC